MKLRDIYTGPSPDAYSPRSSFVPRVGGFFSAAFAPLNGIDGQWALGAGPGPGSYSPYSVEVRPWQRRRESSLPQCPTTIPLPRR